MRIKAFTILEALISMILISIIISLIYTLLTLIGKQVSLFSNQGNEELAYNLFDITIQRDINKAHDFSILDNQIILESYDESTIKYILAKGFILRETHMSIDTFKLKVIEYAIQDRNSHDFHNKIIEIELEVLDARIKANYFLDKNQSHIINNTFYNED